MAETSADWGWLQGEVRVASAAFAAQLGQVSDTTRRVPNLEWNVADLAQHLISLPDLYRDQNERPDFEPPRSWPDFSRSARAHITATAPAELADLLGTATETLLADCGTAPLSPRTLYGQRTTAYNTVAGFLGELLLHGMDLSRLTDATVKLDRRQASAIISQSMAIAPAFVDPVKAQRLDGTYHLHFRHGAHYTYRIVDGRLAVEAGRPESADAHLNADPVAFVLLSLGRMSQLKAAMLAKVIIYGRKPWKIARLNTVVVDGV